MNSTAQNGDDYIAFAQVQLIIWINIRAHLFVSPALIPILAAGRESVLRSSHIYSVRSRAGRTDLHKILHRRLNGKQDKVHSNQNATRRNFGSRCNKFLQIRHSFFLSYSFFAGTGSHTLLHSETPNSVLFSFLVVFCRASVHRIRCCCVCVRHTNTAAAPTVAV